MVVAMFAFSIKAEAQCTADAGQATYSICAGVPLNLNGSGTGAAPLQVNWTGNGSAYLSNTNSLQPTFNFPTPSNSDQSYSLTLSITDADGCVASDLVSISVLATPNAALTTDDGNPDLYVAPGGTSFALCGTGDADYDFQFTDASLAAAGATFSVNWGTPPATFNPSGINWSATHNYGIGLNTLTYTITNPNGCANTLSADVFLGSNPSVGTSNPGNTVVCAGTPLTFPINNVAGNSPGTEYLITYGDGNSTTLQHPPPASITYGYPNTNCPGAPYVFQIEAVTPCPIVSYATAGPIYITDPPVASFTMSADTACVNSSVTFTNTSTGVGGFNCAAPKKVWSISPATGYSIPSGMGNDNGSILPNDWTAGNNAISVQFTQPGTYCITLLVGNSMCGIDSVEHCICIEPPPQPSFTLTPSTGCAPLLTAIDNQTPVIGCSIDWQWNVTGSNAQCGGIVSWFFAGGTSSSSFEPLVQLTTEGTYAVQLQATNSCGTFQQSQNVLVNAPPVIDIDAIGNICAGDCVQPTATVASCGSPITSYAWTFPGGTPANSALLDPGSICFNAATSSNISLTATNACGSVTEAITLQVGTTPPVPAVSSNSPVCNGQMLSITSASIPGVTYSWTGPNNFSANQPSFTIPNVSAVHAGNYTVVVSSGGCAGPPQTVNVQVVPAPVVSVSPSNSTICAGESTTLTASGAGNYQWLIGSNVVFSGSTFVASPQNSTTYTVTGSSGTCPGSTTVTVNVNPLPQVSAGTAQTFCDQAIPMQLSGSPSPGVWSGPNVTPGGVFTPVPGSLGVFPLIYSHTNANGCTDSGTVDITVGSVTEFADAGPDTSFCQGNTSVALIGSPLGGTWSGAGISPGGSFTPATPGSYLATYNYGTGTCATSDQLTITVLASPSIVVPNDLDICADAMPVALNATPIGGNWVGSGTSGPPWQFDPVIAGPGSHTLTYSFSDGDGCTSTADITATVNAIPTVDAGPDQQFCDQPVVVQLTATPIGGVWSAGWMDVSGAGQLLPNGVGTDQLIYSFTSAAGCTSSDTITVDVVAIDEPAFAGNDTAVCVNSDQLQLIGIPAGGTWSGTFVTTDGLFDPSTEGDHLLTYSFGSATCAIQDQITITVDALPVIDAGDDIGVCLDGGPQQLSATPAGGSWSGVGIDPATGIFDPLSAVEGGNPILYTYTDPNTGCTNSDNAIVTVHPLPVASFDHDPIACVGVPLLFNNTSTGANSAEWTFGDAGASSVISPSHIFSSEGEFEIMLIASTGAGCSDTTYSTVTVWDVPVAEFTLSVDSGCGPLEVEFTNASIGEGLSFNWDLGTIGNSTDQDPGPFTFPAGSLNAIEYTITLDASNTCGTSTATTPVVVMPSPTAIFSPDQNTYCAFADVPIANASTGLPDSFQWSFGDGNTSTSADPIVTHAYSVEIDAEDFIISLIATNECGSDTAEHTITVLPNEVTAFFNADPVIGCAPLTVDLTQFSSGDTTWYWDLGDGNVSSAHDLSHTFTEPGTYTVELHAFGCGYDSYSMEIDVLPSPGPTFTTLPATACVGEEVTFTNTTLDVADVNWNFGDGSGSGLSPIEHAFASSGTFNVTLTVTSILNGCIASITEQVTIGATPVAAFVPEPASGCIDLVVDLQNNSSDGDAFQWWFGDGNGSAEVSPQHTYTQAGAHTVTLIAENLNGCTDTTSSIVVAHPLPVSSFTLGANESCVSPIDVGTMNNSLGAAGYSWDFGNGSSSTLQQPAITYEEPGTYTIVLTAINQYGCTDTSSAEFIVHPTPMASFSAQPNPGCARQDVLFTNGSVNSSSYEWSFGNGAFSDQTDPIHVYADPGSFDVTLIATGAGGCTDTLNVPSAVQIDPTPFADFGTDTLSSIRHALRFINLSEGAESFVWDLGDGEHSTEIHPIHLFPADGGGFTVCLVAINVFSCTDTICKYIEVGSDPGIYVPNAFTPNDDGANDVFNPILNGFIGWDYTLMIFDRWGEEIHRTTDRNEGWNGTSRGIDSPIDVYVWKVVVERNGDARDFIGHVSLIR